MSENSDGLLGYLVDAARSGHAAFLDTIMRRDKEILAHAYFEGSDDQDYFAGYVLNHFVDSMEVALYVCNGKREVLLARELLLRNGVGLTKLFFIDRDYDNYLGNDFADDETYVTDFYSVESYLTTRSNIDIIFDLKCLFDRKVREHLAVYDDFFAYFDEFAAAMMRVSAVMIWMRRNSVNANFRALSLAQFGKILEDGKFEPKENVVGILLQKVGAGAIQLDESQVDIIVAEIRPDDARYWIRGKFVSEFVTAYFKRRVLSAKSKRVKRSDGKNIRLHPALATNDISLCGEVGGTALMPVSLRTFLLRYT